MPKATIEFQDTEELLEWASCLKRNRQLESDLSAVYQIARSLTKHGADIEQYQREVERIRSILFDIAND